MVNRGPFLRALYVQDGRYVCERQEPEQTIGIVCGMKAFNIKETILGIFAWLIFRVYSWTFRYQFHYADSVSYELAMKDLNAKKPTPNDNYIYAFWHQDELALLGHFSYKSLVAMVSRSKDGSIMATALKLFGYQTIRASSSRGAVTGFLRAFKMIKRGHRLIMAVDGPRGPIYKVKEGIIKLAEKSGRPIFPFRAKPESSFTFKKAWNKARLPMPFSKIHIAIGKPAFYSKEGLEKELNVLEKIMP